MKPLPDLGSSELRELGAAISQDIYTSDQGVAWGDVAGLEGAKHLLREALVMPLQFPDIFTGILAPWKVGNAHADRQFCTYFCTKLMHTAAMSRCTWFHDRSAVRSTSACFGCSTIAGLSCVGAVQVHSSV